MSRTAHYPIITSQLISSSAHSSYSKAKHSKADQQNKHKSTKMLSIKALFLVAIPSAVSAWEAGQSSILLTSSSHPLTHHRHLPPLKHLHPRRSSRLRLAKRRRRQNLRLPRLRNNRLRHQRHDRKGLGRQLPLRDLRRDRHVVPVHGCADEVYQGPGHAAG